MKSASLFVIPLIALFSLNTQAKDKNQFAYYGVSAKYHKYSDLNFTPDISSAELAPLTLTETLQSPGLRLLAGYQLNRYLAIEGGITKFGKADFSVSEKSKNADGKYITTKIHTGAFKTLGADLMLVATYPFSNTFFVKGVVGVEGWDNSFSYLIEENDSYNLNKKDEQGASLKTGVGVGFGLSKSMALTIDFENTKIAGVNTNSVGVNCLLRF